MDRKIHEKIYSYQIKNYKLFLLIRLTLYVIVCFVCKSFYLFHYNTATLFGLMHGTSMIIALFMCVALLMLVANYHVIPVLMSVYISGILVSGVVFEQVAHSLEALFYTQHFIFFYSYLAPYTLALVVVFCSFLKRKEYAISIVKGKLKYIIITSIFICSFKFLPYTTSYITDWAYPSIVPPYFYVSFNLNETTSHPRLAISLAGALTIITFIIVIIYVAIENIRYYNTEIRKHSSENFKMNDERLL